MASIKNTMLFCVRVTDGYFFPAPNSQFVGVDHVKNTLDDMALESEVMASVKDGRSYIYCASGRSNSGAPVDFPVNCAATVARSKPWIF